MKNNDQNEGAKKKLHLEPFKDVLDDLIKSKRKIFYEDAFFLHFEQQKPIDIFFRLGFAEKGHVLLFGLAFFDEICNIRRRFLCAIRTAYTVR
jgi:hypothetical protein